MKPEQKAEALRLADALQHLGHEGENAAELLRTLAAEPAPDAQPLTDEIERLKCVVDGLETLSLQRDRDYLVEIQRLQKRVEKAEHHNELLRQVDELDAEVERLTAERWLAIQIAADLAIERDALREDAERYRWMTEYRLGWFSRMAPIPWQKQTMKDALDAAIDKARQT